ncbi:uncharacterized protein LOC127856309 isoform X2 [Dreissena polymorpha]|uniref:uncharacterized protein LOC127856309 isoform X2 n=1 Tax=Dreissena polymorpha TaxID=45954 RepID=UPI0022651B5A|nr:uncharacterized protein LOC127856309 isoform X2 [Dreissena polymorpha]
MLKWTKNSKSMSGSYSMKGTQPAGVGVKKGSLATNGNGPPPLTYPADPPDDENMNEIIDDNVELTIHLPDGTVKQQSEDSNIPMMDLLVKIASSSKLNPAAHTLVVLTGDKWKQIDFKANKTIGLLANEDRSVSVQVVKKQKEEKVKLKTANQPFEMTYRFTVNLPGNQKEVVRISPKETLAEVRAVVCQKKNFDPNNYVFLLPSNPSQPLEDSTCIGDLKTNEIRFESKAVVSAAIARSMPDLAFAAARAGSGAGESRSKVEAEKKAKKGFLSFLGKKDNKFKLAHSTSDIDLRSKSQDSEITRSTTTAANRPKTMYVDSGELDHFGLRKTTGDLHKYSEHRKSSGSGLMPLNENVALSASSDNLTSSQKNNKGDQQKKSGKKRAAPPPPKANGKNASESQTVQVEINVQPKSTKQTQIEEVRLENNNRVQLNKNIHSRNSSDSSGYHEYHEMTLSGTESPEANKSDNLQTTLDTTSIDSGEHFNGDSGIPDMSPMRHRAVNRNDGAYSRDSSLDIDKPVAPGRKKKRAPLPPPGMSVAPIDSSSTNTPDSPPPSRGRHTDEEFAALQAMEEVTMRFNLEDSDDDDANRGQDLYMVENSSIHSEDIDLDPEVAHRQRPATFVAPPPPTEPPPDDSVAVTLGLVDTVDIGVGDGTTNSPRDSSKDFPSSKSSRRGSVSSNSSVNTIEDISEAFKLTIAMGEESLGDFESDHSDDSVQDELKKAMPEFKKHIASLVLQGSDGEESTNGTPLSKDPSSSSPSSQHKLLHSDRDISAQGDRDSSEITYEFTVASVPSGFQNLSQRDSEEESFETEEIVEYYPAQQNVLQHALLETGSPRVIPDLESPKEHAKAICVHPHDVFQDIDVEGTDDVKDDDKDLNEKVKVKEVEVTRVVDTEVLNDTKTVDIPEQTKEKPVVVKVKKPEEKEEFVITFDELSTLDFSASNPNDQKKPRREFSDTPKVNYRIEFRNSRDFDEEVIQASNTSIVNHAPVFDETSGKQTVDINIANQCSNISFQPNSEGEAENLLEEKSISFIALPAERTAVKEEKVETNDEVEVNLEKETFASKTVIQLSQSSPPVISHTGSRESLQTSSRESSKTSSRNSTQTNSRESTPRRSDDDAESANLMQTQYQQMQQQMAMWQNQLLQNQQLLASSLSPDPPSPNQTPGIQDQSSLQLQQLQLQIQMQQQMLLQLQQSIATISFNKNAVVGPSQQQTLLQTPAAGFSTPPNTGSSGGNSQMSSPNFLSGHEFQTSTPIPDMPSQRGQRDGSLSQVPVAPTLPPAPGLEAKSKEVKADAKYTKPKQKRFERQLDPREQLMLDIRNFGKKGLNKSRIRRFQSRPLTGINDEIPIYV